MQNVETRQHHCNPRYRQSYVLPQYTHRGQDWESDFSIFLPWKEGRGVKKEEKKNQSHRATRKRK